MSLLDRFGTEKSADKNSGKTAEKNSQTEKKDLLPQDKLKELIQNRQNLKKTELYTKSDCKSSFISRYAYNLGIIDTILADDEINSIFVNGAKNIYIEKKGKTIKSNSSFPSEYELQNTIEGLLKHRGFNIEDEKFFQFNYKKGVNLTITLPPLSQKITIILKNYNNKFASLKALQENQIISKEIALFLEALIAQNVNILITGEEKTLKTTVLDSLIKAAGENLKSVIIDFSNEIETDKNTCAFYDLTNFNNGRNFKNEEKLIDSVFSINPDKIFINDLKSELKEKIFEFASSKKGLVVLSNSNDSLNLPFDIIIKTKNIKKENETLKKIVSISQIYNNEIQEIFKLNDENKLESTGIIPKVYFEMKSNLLNINQNIFEKNYRHTYSQNYNENLAQFKAKFENNTETADYENQNEEKKGLNLEVLKKFKPNINN